MSGRWKEYGPLRYPYKTFQDEKVSEIAKEKRVLDLGGGGRFQKWLREYEPLFKDVDYQTFDYDGSTGADVVGDIHNIPLPEGSVDAVICYSVLEHVYDPRKAVSEMHRILKPGGKLLLYVPSTYPYHARKGHYHDYWRFFDDALEMLFEEWSEFTMEKVGGYFRALFFFVPLQHRLRWLLDPLSYLLDKLFRTDRRNTTSGYIVYARK